MLTKIHSRELSGKQKVYMRSKSYDNWCAGSILYISTQLVNNAAEIQPYYTDVNGVYQITESIKLVRNTEHFGAGSNLVVSTWGSTATISFSFLLILIKTFHGFHR